MVQVMRSYTTITFAFPGIPSRCRTAVAYTSAASLLLPVGGEGTTSNHTYTYDIIMRNGRTSCPAPVPDCSQSSSLRSLLLGSSLSVRARLAAGAESSSIILLHLEVQRREGSPLAIAIGSSLRATCAINPRNIFIFRYIGASRPKFKG